MRSSSVLAFRGARLTRLHTGRERRSRPRRGRRATSPESSQRWSSHRSPRFLDPVFCGTAPQGRLRRMRQVPGTTPNRVGFAGLAAGEFAPFVAAGAGARVAVGSSSGAWRRHARGFWPNQGWTGSDPPDRCRADQTRGASVEQRCFAHVDCRTLTVRRLLAIAALSASLLLPATVEAVSPAIEVAFSPNCGATDLVVRTIDSSKTGIRVAAYSFTSKPISTALLAAHKRGVDVRVVVDRSNATARYTAATFLANQGGRCASITSAPSCTTNSSWWTAWPWRPAASPSPLLPIQRTRRTCWFYTIRRWRSGISGNGRGCGGSRSRRRLGINLAGISLVFPELGDEFRVRVDEEFLSRALAGVIVQALPEEPKTGSTLLDHFRPRFGPHGHVVVAVCVRLTLVNNPLRLAFHLRLKLRKGIHLVR